MSAATIDGLKLRAVLGRKEWDVPTPFGPDGWFIMRADRRAGVIVTAFEWEGEEWIHASIAHHDKTVPTYEELVLLRKAVFGAGYAYQVFAPPSEHINIHEYTLHLWGRADGAAVLPEFGAGGSI